MKDDVARSGCSNGSLSVHSLATADAPVMHRMDMMAERHSWLRACSMRQHASTVPGDAGKKTGEILIADELVGREEKASAAMRDRLRIILATTAFCWNPGGN